MSDQTETVRVSQVVRVTIDESKFDEAFMMEFRESFYPFYELDEHVEHLAQLYARGICDDSSFIEGYGQAADMGIKFEHVHQSMEVERQ